MELVTIGLLLIIAGWAVQLSHDRRGRKDFSIVFLALYVVGCEMLAIDAVMNNALVNGILNLLCAILPALILTGMLKTGGRKS
ncbi:MAG: hypothetical protein PHG85_06285 [Candidatus Altiarchaeota archaeon]|nr:hypothetical protein [Candidatus Altiarchaeota archaeon]